MNKYLSINIANSCHENWDTMNPNSFGKHCNTCQKTVLDFTSMTDTELLNYFTKNKSKNICGRFLDSQLQKNILIPKKHNWLKYFFKITIPAFLLTSKSNAQATVPNTKIENTPINKKIIQGDTIVNKQDSTEVMVVGVVIDQNNEVVPYASITSQKTKKGVFANANGEFNILVSKNDFLIFSAVNYESKTLAVKKHLIPELKKIETISEITVTTGMVDYCTSTKNNQHTTKILSSYVYPMFVLNIKLSNAQKQTYTVEIKNAQLQVVQKESFEITKKNKPISITIGNHSLGNYFIYITNTKTKFSTSHPIIIQ